MSRTEPSGARPSGRTPPQNLQAEESLLGAMLLSRDAIAAAAEIVQAEHFYKPAHAHVYDAILGLYGVGEPADVVTVAEELRRAGLLDAVGGPGALVTLQASAPAVSNAARYARIIEELALLRRMIAAAGEIAEIGYSVPEDVAKAVDLAESMVFSLGQHRAAGTTATLRNLLEQTLDRLEELYDRGETITGTPTGYLDLDEILSGLQPNALVVVGARPAMGKALALGTPLPTPTGWTTMGDVQVGDEVLADDGRPCRVTYATAVQHDRACYEVEFDDGSVIVADAGHRWSAYELPARGRSTRSSRPRLVTTQEMVDAGVRRADDGGPWWWVPLASALELPAVELPLAPHLLGARLGDGQPAGAPLAAAHGVVRPEPGSGVLHEVVPPKPRGLDAPGRERIPAGYLRASADQRRALLQGLMDTAGTVADADGTVELCLADRSLLAQARELVCSLGHKPGPIRREVAVAADGRRHECWRFGWTPLGPVSRLSSEAGRLAPTAGRHRSDRTAGRAVVDIRPVASVPVRCITVDSPSHLYLAGESMIPTHNTAFSLGMATHAALHAGRPALFFSLEMSQMEITQRILCSEARVDASRMRNGRLTEGDWEKISHAVGRLAEAPIWVDDNPNLTIMEIRSKARKLKSQVGDLGVVVVDYIQLMTGRNSAESRQVEVAEISRGLKILAREIETPVVALAQLNRSLEQRADKRPMLSDLRESGCLPARARILRADNGEEVAIGELVRSGEQPLVWSLDECHRLVPARLTKAFPSGTKPTFRLRLASGRQVEATANHPFLTVTGWRRLDELCLGGRVAVPRRTPAPLSAGDRDGDGEPGPAQQAEQAERAEREASDVLWDEIVEISPCGKQPTFDATIEGTHNFIADGVIVHNSLEQDADVVLFLYRDEVYNRDSPEQGIAEVIVAKHRSGPTGVARLAFLGQYTRFANMAKG